MRATLQQIESFYWVARLGGFHAAARHQHLTQPTISARVHELEEILGCKLFERSAYRAEITPLGRDVLTQAEKMLRMADELEKTAKQGNPMRGLLRLGTNESTAMAGLIELLGELKIHFPDLRVELTVDVGTTLSRKLNARELDLTLLTDPVSAPHVVDEAIGRAELAWVASARMPLSKRELTPADIALLPIVTMPPPSSLHGVVAAWFRGANCPFENFSTCNSLSLMVQLVAAGHAVALLPRAIVKDGIEGGILRVIAAKPLIAPRTYYVSYLREEKGLEDGAIVRMAREVLMQTGLLLPL